MKNKTPELIEGKFSGKISFDDLEFGEIITKQVEHCNKTSGRIYLSSKLVGKTVYILIKKGDMKK